MVMVPITFRFATSITETVPAGLVGRVGTRAVGQERDAARPEAHHHATELLAGLCVEDGEVVIGFATDPDRLAVGGQR